MYPEFNQERCGSRNLTKITPLNYKTDQEIESFDHEIRVSIGNEGEGELYLSANSAVADRWNDRMEREGG